MPIYEYRCPHCRGTFQRLVRGFSDPTDLACPRCRATDVTRVVSQVAHLHGAAAVTERFASTDTFAGIEENDPAAVARWAKALGHRLGDVAGADWNESVDQMIDEERADGAAGAAARGDTDLGWG